MKIKINGTNLSLRDYLVGEGFAFPCGAKGACGRCRIVAPTLEITELDKRFLSDEEISRGIRLACNKTINGNVEIDCLLERATSPHKLSAADVYVILGNTTTEIGITDGDFCEEISLASPQRGYTSLRAVAQKNAIELYERHSLAKATTLLLAGSPERIADVTGIIEPLTRGDTVEASLFQMPAEEVYLPPVPNALIGSDFLLELLGVPVGTLAVYGEYFAYVADNSVYAARLAYDDKAPQFYYATLVWFTEEYAPSNFICVGENTIAEELGARRTSRRAPENAVLCLNGGNRNRTALDKLARKIELVELAENNAWQEVLNRISK